LSECARALSNLDELSLAGTQLTSADGLKDLRKLRTLDLSNCRNLTSVDGLKELSNLDELSLAGTQLTSADGLKDLRKLRALDLSNCRNLTSVDGLKELKNLRTLYLSKNQFPTEATNELRKQLPQMEITYQ